MVQMKLVRNIDELMQSLYFISHMVQMKRYYRGFCGFCKFNFISHMVQMKPAGGTEILVPLAFFISHMVQMKLTGQGRLFSDEKTLYPTWFR